MTLSPAGRQRLALEARSIPALLQVGKNGLSPSFIEELSRMTKARGLVKVRLLKSFSEENDTKAIAEDLARQAGLDVVSVIGNTLVFFFPLTKRRHTQKAASRPQAARTRSDRRVITRK